MKEIISVTEITSYLYCPKKVYLKRVKNLREPANKAMILGFLKHKVFDIFNKNEMLIVSSIKNNMPEQEISSLYKAHLLKLIKETLDNYSNMVFRFKIDPEELREKTLEFMEKEIKLRVDSIKKYLELGFFRKDLWRNLKPKFLTEYEIVSEELGLKGRIDRVKFQEGVIPYELKTRDSIFESDKLQLAAYVLLLENEFGKQIKTGVIETATKTEQIEITQELKQKVLDLAEEIRNLDKEPNLPENFAKCKPCFFKENCFEI